MSLQGGSEREKLSRRSNVIARMRGTGCEIRNFVVGGIPFVIARVVY